MPFHDYEKEKVAQVLRNMNLNESIRGEALSLEQYAEFTNHII